MHRCFAERLARPRVCLLGKATLEPYRLLNVKGLEGTKASVSLKAA
jgi:hypothetical protein